MVHAFEDAPRLALRRAVAQRPRATPPTALPRDPLRPLVSQQVGPSPIRRRWRGRIR